MKKWLMFIIISLFSSFVYAGGGITHQFIAREIINQLPDKNLQNLLKNNLDAYLVGAYYPDSGFIDGTHYGEDSHWDPFIYTFADYIKEKYEYPELQNPKLVAFLFGCAVHRLSDEIIHWTFYPVMSEHDFAGDWHTDGTHNHGDIGIDLLLVIDKNQWFTQPSVWWVPIQDLVQVYHRMGKDEYSAKEITWGSSVLFFAGYGERMIAAPAYPYLKLKMPWTAQNYFGWPEGGIAMDATKTSEYMMGLWDRLHNKNSNNSLIRFNQERHHSYHEENNSLFVFATQALQKGLVNYSSVTNEDGSVEMSSPIVTSYFEFQKMVDELVGKITGK